MSTAAATADSLVPETGWPVFYPESFWRTLKQLNAFRIFLAVFLTVAVLFADRLQILTPDHGVVLLGMGVVYLSLAAAFHVSLRRLRPSFDYQLVAQLLTDTVVIGIYMLYGGGGALGLGLVLTVPMAAAGLHPRPRMMLFLVSLASLAVLLVQGVGVLAGGAPEGMLRAGLLSVGFFTLAGISHVLAKGALASARVAGEKAQQAADLVRINSKVIQDLPYGVMVLDRQGSVLLFNPQAETLIGCPVHTQGGLADCTPALAEVWRAWLAGTGPDTAVLRLGEADRRLRVRLLELGPDRAAGAVVVIEDMSELEQVATHMKLASLGRLTANLAHEIRNPLSAINQAAQILGEDAAGNPATARLTRIIEDNVSRLNYLVEDVLSLSRRDRRNREAIPLDHYLTEFVAEFRQAEDIAEGVIHVEATPGLRVWFDRLHLHQILWNLCRNAIRHCSGAPGSIRISAAAAGDTVQVEIYNDGPGIPAETRVRLFEPFYSTDKAGTGLGLYIALDLAEANEGSLRCVECEQGVLFRLNGRLAP